MNGSSSLRSVRRDGKNVTFTSSPKYIDMFHFFPVSPFMFPCFSDDIFEVSQSGVQKKLSTSRSSSCISFQGVNASCNILRVLLSLTEWKQSNETCHTPRNTQVVFTYHYHFYIHFVTARLLFTFHIESTHSKQKVDKTSAQTESHLINHLKHFNVRARGREKIQVPNIFRSLHTTRYVLVYPRVLRKNTLRW